MLFYCVRRASIFVWELLWEQSSRTNEHDTAGNRLQCLAERLYILRHGLPKGITEVYSRASSSGYSLPYSPAF